MAPPYVATKIATRSLKGQEGFAERFVFATDYNHSDSKFPHTVQEVMERKDISDALKTEIVGENAAKLYKL